MSDRRPILLIVDICFTVFGGVERVMLNVLPLLNRRWRVIYCDLWSNGAYAGQMRAAGVEVLHLLPEARSKYIGRRGSLLRMLLLALKAPRLGLALLKLRRWLNAHKPAVLYFNRLELIGSAMAFVPRKFPCVYHSHGFPSSADVPRRAVGEINRRFYRAMAASQRTADLLAEAGVRREKLVRVYNAVDPRAIEGAAGAGPGLPPRAEGDVVFVHVAVVAPHKGQDVGIEALGLIADRRVKLWICGDLHSEAQSPYKQSLERRVAELRLGDRVCFLGWRTDAAHVIAGADVVILPSKTESESFGMALVEGMALGKPCIGTTRGGVPEVIADGVTGFVREPTAEAFAEVMRALANSQDLRRRMGERAVHRVRELFTLDRQAEEIASVVEGAMASKACGHE